MEKVKKLIFTLVISVLAIVPVITNAETINVKNSEELLAAVKGNNTVVLQDNITLDKDAIYTIALIFDGTEYSGLFEYIPYQRAYMIGFFNSDSFFVTARIDIHDSSITVYPMRQCNGEPYADCQHMTISRVDVVPVLS